MNECPLQATADLHRYLDGELDASATASVETHLRLCRSCRENLSALDRPGSVLRAAYTPEMPADLTQRFVQRARESQLQNSRRIAWGLVMAASLLLVSSLALVRYSQSEAVEGPAVMAQWEENVVAPPIEEEEFVDLNLRTLVAIHMERTPGSGNGHE